MNILIVDDMAENLCLLQAMLEGAGYGVVSAGNGREALEQLQVHDVGCIISDILMPVMDGFQLCRECKTNPAWKEIPFIFYTATYTEKKDQDFALSLGTDAYAVKPQEPETLIKIIAQVLAEGKGRESATTAKIDAMDEKAYLAEHNWRLVNKLESKMADLEKTNRLLRESEEKYRLVVDNAAEAILIAQDERIQFANPGCASLLGYSVEALAGSPFIEFLHPEDREMVLDLHRRRLQGEELPFVYPFRIMSATDTPKWVEIHVVWILWKGRPASLTFLSDITTRKHAEQALDESIANLRKALNGSIQAIAKIVEARDPYTAGHERRVAHLAVAIAEEMGLEPDRITALGMSGMIHDIGKIAVPAEILSKPTKLTPTEMTLIQVHPQIGYDILSEIDFPWPIAKTVLQHHERMDGSGYPQGLKGDEIILKARILAVADTVEAMATHRPYRPALGIDAALGEISRGKSIFYDLEVVEACLSQFNQKGYLLLD